MAWILVGVGTSVCLFWPIVCEKSNSDLVVASFSASFEKGVRGGVESGLLASFASVRGEVMFCLTVLVDTVSKDLLCGSPLKEGK